MKLNLIALLICGFTLASAAAEPGTTAIVVYNSQSRESKDVAMHYAERRQVPADQVFGLSLPLTETMSRAEYIEKLQKPLLKLLEEKHLFVFDPKLSPSNKKRGTNFWVMKSASIRYAVLCYGVPLRITNDPAWVEPNQEKVQENLRRNGAAVDSELCLLPVCDRVTLTGPLPNHFYGITNSALPDPMRGLLMVARLDGPTPEIARGLVDKAIQAETDGLWGRGYFDLRSITNGYKKGDDAIRAAAKVTEIFGFSSTVDTNPETFPTYFPMSQIAFYAGWYDGNVSGPFARPDVEFMPGAFAYHLHSFSAATVRSVNQNWVGPLLKDGATATMGCVDEPFLEFTPDMSVFFSRWLLLQFSFGEAAYASQPALSWQTTVVGDPLYRPFAKPPQKLHEELAQRNSKLIEWSHLRVVGLALVKGAPIDKVVEYLTQQEITRKSAILSEKLAELYGAQGKPQSCIRTYKEALKLNPSPQQKVRMNLALADKLMEGGQDAEAFALYDEVAKQSPDWLQNLSLCQKLRELANKLNKPTEAGFYAAAVKRLTEKK